MGLPPARRPSEPKHQSPLPGARVKLLLLQLDPIIWNGTTACVASTRAAGHEVCLRIVPEEKGGIAAILRDTRPDAIAFPTVLGVESWARQSARELRSLHGFTGPILAGGSYATYDAEYFLADQSVDYVCRGECDDVLPEALTVLESGRPATAVQNVWSRNDGQWHRNPSRRLIDDLDTLPFADPSDYFRYPFIREFYRWTYPIMTGRGCTELCTYCVIPTQRAMYAGNGKAIRKRTPENVIEELVWARSKFGVRMFKFEDTLFLLGESWVEKFFALYRERVGLPFRGVARPAFLTEPVVRTLARSGCHSIICAYESGNEKLRREVLGKRETNAAYREAAQRLRAHGILFQANNILGSPGESLDLALETYAMNVTTRPVVVDSDVLRVDPGAPLSQLAEVREMRPPDELINLQQIMYLCVVLKVPASIVRRLVQLPRNPVFFALGRLAYALGLKRSTGIPWAPFVRYGWHVARDGDLVVEPDRWKNDRRPVAAPLAAAA